MVLKIPSTLHCVGRAASLLSPAYTWKSKVSSLFTNISTYSSSLSNSSNEIVTSTPQFKTLLKKFLKINCKSGDFTLPQALHFFDQMIHMEHPPPTSQFNQLLGALAKNKHHFHVISLFKRMNSTGIFLDLISFNIMLNSICSVIRMSDGFVILGVILRRGWRPSTVTFNSLMNGMCMEGKIAEAVRLLGKMGAFGCCPSVLTYNTLINGFCNGKRLSDGFVVLGVILRRGYRPDIVTFNSLVREMCMEGNIAWASRLFKKMGAFGCSPSVITCNTLITGLCRTGNSNFALMVLEEMVNGNGDFGLCGKPNAVTYSCIIDSLCKQGLVEKAKKFFVQMKDRGIVPDVITYTSLLQGLCDMDKWEEAKCLFIEMLD